MISRLCALFSALLFAALFATSFPASAGQWFTMVGGICTNSIPFAEECHNQHVTAQIQMVDGYVPGTPFFASMPAGDPSPIAEFLLSIGGVITWSSDFPTFPPGSCCGVYNAGVMSDIAGVSGVQIHWFDGWSFDAEGNDWLFALDNGSGGLFYSGTFTDWVPGRIPEPQSLALVLAGLLALISVQSRRSRMV